MKTMTKNNICSSLKLGWVHSQIMIVSMKGLAPRRNPPINEMRHGTDFSSKRIISYIKTLF